MGSLTIIFGPMFSGKTTRLIQELTRIADVSVDYKHKILLINHSFDNRSDVHKFSTHNSSIKGISGLIDITQADSLATLNIMDYDTIGIDEGQFFKDLDYIIHWVNKGKNVIVSGLIADAFMKPFGKINELVVFADTVIQCHAICSECIKTHSRIITPDALHSMKAPFTYRLSGSKNQIEVGASDIYIPVCRRHYQELKNN